MTFILIAVGACFALLAAAIFAFALLGAWIDSKMDNIRE
jgi:hypothetical protein